MWVRLLSLKEGSCRAVVERVQWPAARPRFCVGNLLLWLCNVWSFTTPCNPRNQKMLTSARPEYSRDRRVSVVWALCERDSRQAGNNRRQFRFALCKATLRSGRRKRPGCQPSATIRWSLYLYHFTAPLHVTT